MLTEDRQYCNCQFAHTVPTLLLATAVVQHVSLLNADWPYLPLMFINPRVIVFANNVVNKFGFDDRNS